MKCSEMLSDSSVLSKLVIDESYCLTIARNDEIAKTADNHSICKSTNTVIMEDDEDTVEMCSEIDGVVSQLNSDTNDNEAHQAIKKEEELVFRINKVIEWGSENSHFTENENLIPHDAIPCNEVFGVVEKLRSMLQFYQQTENNTASVSNSMERSENLAVSNALMKEEQGNENNSSRLSEPIEEPRHNNSHQSKFRREMEPVTLVPYGILSEDAHDSLDIRNSSEIPVEIQKLLHNHYKLTQLNMKNTGRTEEDLNDLRELLRCRLTLTAMGRLRAENFLDGIPENVRQIVGDLANTLKYYFDHVTE